MRAQLVRSAVLEIYEQVRREGARADQALQGVLRREKQLRSVERRAVSDAVYGLLRLQGRIDHLLQRALATRGQALDKLATPTQHLLRYAAYLVAAEAQSARSAAGLAGPEVSPWEWALELVADPAPLGAPQDPLDALAEDANRVVHRHDRRERGHGKCCQQEHPTGLMRTHIQAIPPHVGPTTDAEID